jgi:hypothetical protein
MAPFSQRDADGDDGPRLLWEDGEHAVCREWRPDTGSVLVVRLAAERPSPAGLERLAHEYGLKDELDATWAVRPLELRQEHGRTALLLEDQGGEPLDRWPGAPMAMSRFLEIALGIVTALGKAYQRELLHKDNQTGEYSGEPRHRRGQAHRVRHRIAPATRAAGARAARIHRRHPRLHGPRTDRAHELLGRRPQRSFPGLHGRWGFCVRGPYRLRSGLAGGRARRPYRGCPEFFAARRPSFRPSCARGRP